MWWLGDKGERMTNNGDEMEKSCEHFIAQGILQMIEVCWTGQGTLSNSIGVGGSTDGSSNDSISL